ncbi:MFS general substrate transporter [Tricholoma matsutake]|nr:MFS general substrate transporter [Tricholoma matsutake 945]
MTAHTSPSALEHAAQDLEPEGGARAWCTVAGGWLALFATFGYVSSFGVYQDLYVLAGTSSSSNISWIGSTQFFLFLAMGLPAGRLLDKGYFKPVVGVGVVIYVFSIFMLSLAHIQKYYQLFLAQGIGMGLGAGLIYLPVVAVQAHHWRRRTALAMGITVTGMPIVKYCHGVETYSRQGSSIGGIVYPIILNNFFNNSVGFAWGIRASGFMTLAVLIVASCLMSANPAPKKAETPKPPTKLRDILTDIPFIVAPIAGGFLIILGLFFPYFYLQLYTVLHGLPSNFAFYTLTIQNGASIFGRTLPNWLAVRFGVLNVIIVMTLGSGVMIFALFGVTTVAGVAVFAVLYGFFSGAVLSLSAPIIASFARDPSEVGMRMGVAYFLLSWAYLIGPPISGALLDSGGGVHWSNPIIFSGVRVPFSS